MTEHTHPTGGQVGTAAQEAAKLFSAVEDWARNRSGRLFDDEHLATGAAECQTCPICQGITLLRHVRPETVEHLLDATASLVAAVRAAFAGQSGPEPAPRAAGVEHITIQEPNA